MSFWKCFGNSSCTEGGRSLLSRQEVFCARVISNLVPSWKLGTEHGTLFWSSTTELHPSSKVAILWDHFLAYLREILWFIWSAWCTIDNSWIILALTDLVCALGALVPDYVQPYKSYNWQVKARSYTIFHLFTSARLETGLERGFIRGEPPSSLARLGQLLEHNSLKLLIR